MLRYLENITVHCTVCNEEYWIWFALQAMTNLPLKILLCDTGSEDLTPEIIKHCRLPQIEYRKIGKINPHEHALLRNEMIRDTQTEWFAIVDGDEIWPLYLWRQIHHTLNDPHVDILIVPNISPFPRLGYVGHGDTEFTIAGVKGEYYAKVFRIKNNLRWRDDFSSSFLAYEDGTVISGGNLPSMQVMATPMTHLTMLPRSPLDAQTLGRDSKLNIGGTPSIQDFFRIPSLTLLPEILLKHRPPLVKNPFIHENYEYAGMAPVPFEFLLEI